VAGKEGTFVLQDAGTVEGNVVSGDWFVVPGSGTGQLAGLRGAGGFRANLGEGAQVHLDYRFRMTASGRVSTSKVVGHRRADFSPRRRRCSVA
jgi:Protein of unknown function (DUF3224)